MALCRKMFTVYFDKFSIDSAEFSAETACYDPGYIGKII